MPQFKTQEIDGLRSLVDGAFRQIIYLRRNRDNGKTGRFALLSLLAGRIAQVQAECDLPSGYTDPDDPFADVALEMLRAEFAELQRGDALGLYPVPAGTCCLLNGKRLD